jgi:hypothetical protein
MRSERIDRLRGRVSMADMVTLPNDCGMRTRAPIAGGRGASRDIFIGVGAVKYYPK